MRLSLSQQCRFRKSAENIVKSILVCQQGQKNPGTEEPILEPNVMKTHNKQKMETISQISSLFNQRMLP